VYFILVISVEMVLFRQMYDMKCTSFPRFPPFGQNVVHEMSFIVLTKCISCTTYSGSDVIRLYNRAIKITDCLTRDQVDGLTGHSTASRRFTIQESVPGESPDTTPSFMMILIPQSTNPDRQWPVHARAHSVASSFIKNCTFSSWQAFKLRLYG